MRKENADAAQNKKRYDEPNHETGLDEKYAEFLGLADPSATTRTSAFPADEPGSTLGKGFR
jgi:hypothetical protein